MNTRPALANPSNASVDFAEGSMNEAFASPAKSAGALEISRGVIVAQRVAVQRNTAKVLGTIKALAARAGRERYIYRWTVRNRRAGTSDEISGPTIKCALDVAREYGNCGVNVVVDDAGTHLVFYATFSDYETGFQLTRAFQQRKSQDIGMADKERGADLVFQVGQSKAIRNVIINALSTYIDFAVEEAERGMLEWVSANLEKARERVQSLAAQNNLTMERIEQAFGRPFDRFSEKDVASALTRVKGIDDGLSLADDEFPEVQKQERSAADPIAASKKAAPAKAAAIDVPAAEQVVTQQEPAVEKPADAAEADKPAAAEVQKAAPAKAAPAKAAPPKAVAKPAAKSPLNFEE